MSNTETSSVRSTNCIVYDIKNKKCIMYDL